MIAAITSRILTTQLDAHSLTSAWKHPIRNYLGTFTVESLLQLVCFLIHRTTRMY